MDANSFFISQKVNQVASQAASAIMRVRNARTLRQVRDDGHVIVPSYLGSAGHDIPELRRLKQAQEERAKELVDLDLAKMDAIAAQHLPIAERIELLKTAYGNVRQHNWTFLRGEHPGLYTTATRHVERLISQLQAKVSATPD